MTQNDVDPDIAGIAYSMAYAYDADVVVDPKSSLFGLDLQLSTVNLFLTILGWGDVLQNLIMLVTLIIANGEEWTLLITLGMLMLDLFSIYVSSLNAPLGIKSVYVEKFLLSAIHMVDIFFDYGVITMFIFAGVWFNEDYFLLGVMLAALPILAGNYLQLYYTYVQYEKDHAVEIEYDFENKDAYI